MPLPALVAACCLAGPELIARLAIPGDARDLSRLESPIAPDVPHDLLGAFGSGICPLGTPGLYAAICDRGPLDGASRYRCRFQVLRLALSASAPWTLHADLVETVLLTHDDLRPCLGFAHAYNPEHQDRSQRLDPEAICRTPEGTLLIAEEYGPFVDEFSREGRHLRRIVPPAKFLVAEPDGDPANELPPRVTSGRQANRGFEGLALTPDGTHAIAVLQSPLLQDHALDSQGKRAGVNIRMLVIDRALGTTRELVYPLESPRHGVSEALALSATSIVILERDGSAGSDATFRRLYVADLAGATDVSGIESLPGAGLPAGVAPVSKKLLLDLCDPDFGLAGPSMPEKIEGVCPGPVLPDGRRTLLVTTDNDLRPQDPTWIWLFAFAEGDLPGERAPAR